MKTIQITVDENLLQNVDKAIKKMHTTRSAFIRRSLQTSLKSLETLRLESRHREGYKNKPVTKDEVSGWETEQVWGD